ncbi:interleukin-31 receptor subunit alpha-like isoform 2-T2 [Polymixia lowei]
MYSFSALYILIVIPAICEGDNEKTCNVINKNRYVELGSDVKIMCQSLCILPDKTYWTLNNDLIDDRLSETINSSYTVLSLRNFTTQSATVQCHGFVTGHVIGGTTIRTYAKPSKISCILQNPIWYSPTDFSCNWEHKMSSSLEITYTVHRKCAFYSENCTSKTTSCTFKMAPLLGKNFSITVRASTTAWEVVSDTYEFDPYHIWKITAPEIQVTALSDQLLVELNQRQLEHHQVHCQVEYNKSLSGGTQEQLLNIVINPLDGRKNVTIEEVESCTDYTVSARCALDKAPWSDWSQKKTVLSQLKKSTVKLGLWRKLADPGKNGVRKVYVMWTEIPSSCKGEFYYTIDVTPYKKYTPLVDENYHTDAFCNASACDVNVGPDAHSITLTVLHNGNPLGNESIYVPAFGESLPQVKHIQTSTHEGDIVLRWQAPVENVSGYMVDWTHDGKKHYWKENKYTNTTLYDLEDFKQYNVTVTPLFDDKTGLGTQAIQICSRERVPETISISEVLAEDRSALVTWNKESQFQCSGGVVNYAVFYRTEKGSQLNVTVDSTKREALLEDLKPATKYSVHVMAIALTGNSSSIDRYFETKRYGGRSSQRWCLTLDSVLWPCGLPRVIKRSPSHSIIHLKARPSLRRFTLVSWTSLQVALLH